MSKTFTCRELGGICDEKFSGESFGDIVKKGMEHMAIDNAHMNYIAEMAERTGEDQDQWFDRMQKEFDARPEDK
jgi:hypothetical protein